MFPRCERFDFFLEDERSGYARLRRRRVEEVLKGRFLMGTVDVDEVSKCAGKGSLDGKPCLPKRIHMLLMGLQCHVHTAAKHYV